FTRSVQPTWMRSFPTRRSSDLNLEAMDELKLKYVTRLGASKLEELLASLPAEQSPELWDRTQVMEIVREGKLASNSSSLLAPKRDRKSTRLNSSHVAISYAVCC